MKFNLFNNMIVLRSPIQRFRLPTLLTWGLTNRVGGKYFFMADYDKVDYDVVKDDMKQLQKDFHIGPVLVRVSSLYGYKQSEVGSYHCYGFYLYDFPTVKKLISLTRCDDSFKKGYRYQARCFVLRIGEKVNSVLGSVNKPFTVYKEVLTLRCNGRMKRKACSALINLFEKIDDIRLSRYFKRTDGSKELEFIRYMTR